MYVCMYVCTYVCMYVCVAYVCMYVCMYVCICFPWSIASGGCIWSFIMGRCVVCGSSRPIKGYGMHCKTILLIPTYAIKQPSIMEGLGNDVSFFVGCSTER